jgi:4'-phosphopantetheinyl transferase
MTAWMQPPCPLSLTRTEVHLWLLRLTPGDPGIECHRAVLSAEELQAADRFCSAVDRRRYLECHGTLRSLLGRYLGVQSASIALGRGAHGKPELKGNLSLRFNLSHSGEVALFAFARDVEVGVDVERPRDGIDVESLAGQVCSPSEIHRLHCLRPEERLGELLTYWTQKEAYLKATGTGLSVRPSTLRLSRDLTGWALHSFRCHGDYWGALAVRESHRRLRFFQA